MAVGTFVIQELPVDGSPGVRFEWTSDRKPPSGNEGGARACPIQPWPLGGKLRTVRTDYPGAQDPSEQILGSSQKPYKLSGQWDDRYNFEGYAVAEMNRFNAMCERGNPVRCQFLSITREGFIIDWDTPYKREWQIGYSFEMSVHRNPSAPHGLNRSPATTETPSTLYDKTDTSVQALLDAHNECPRSQLGGTLATDSDGDLNAIASASDGLGGTLDNRELQPPEKPIDAFTRLATQFRQVGKSASDLLLTLEVARSDVDLVTRTAMSVLSFESWSRSLRFQARILAGNARAGDDNCAARAAPDATRLYRPQQGESLYAIARKFYGTPNAWGLIYQRNSLQSFTLQGTEILVIPERGGV